MKFILNAEIVAACERALNDFKVNMLTKYSSQVQSVLEPLPMTASEVQEVQFLTNRHHSARKKFMALTEPSELGHT